MAGNETYRISIKNGHCGIMPNYECSAACRHCLYACSPTRSVGYMSKAMMEETCRTLAEGGCRSVHIGGGEPFLDFDGLISLLNNCKKFGIAVEYIETNASWVESDADITERLRALAKAGADTLCISVDPYHAEYVPYAKPLKLAEICGKIGFGYFLWQERFLRVMDGLDAGKAHDRDSLEKNLGGDYINDVARMYGLRMGGRAINIETEYSPRKPLGDVLKSSPCQGLLSVGHFHVDMYNRFIPPGCTGLVVPMKEITAGITLGRYPAFEALLTGGVKKLYDIAASEHDFAPDPMGYSSGCALCFHIRRHLSKLDGFSELDAEFYEESLLY